jgi:predicted nucleic acid-binding protein
VSWLLDTNVVSELARPRPDANVVAWIDRRSRQQAHLYLSALTLAELYRGVMRIDRQTPRFARLWSWVRSDVTARFAGRILPFDADVAQTWGEMTAALPKGVVVPTMDSLIAATARHYGLFLVTRNVADMRHFSGLAADNPWLTER